MFKKKQWNLVTKYNLIQHANSEVKVKSRESEGLTNICTHKLVHLLAAATQSLSSWNCII